MLRRPFAFWLPAFVLLFLCWAWADSRRNSSAVSLGFMRGQEIECVIITAEDSSLVLGASQTHGLRPPKNRPVFAGSHRHDLPPKSSTPWFPRPKTEILKEGIGTSSGPIRTIYRNLHIPFWCIIPAYFAAWMFLLHRWNKRLRLRPMPQSRLETSA
ncbi:hypothetical protein OJ996_25640 [Luteolibacter sp. GHJ8]|uniref:Uncharacterized protein n=1 Tax=Luteolibacter rhizosphaerae TaxID=2989719 RepID=A0ABT3GAY5_9BACT|nr:hypothetical protein [Luteolibacter rhizosphaerae]MCW1916998.1 hypothetical protein [Luteolibacter rhizosphaerae]